MDPTIETLQKRVTDLEAENASLREQLKPQPQSKREKEILRRMTEGRISRSAAEQATDHQFANDAAIAAEKDEKKPAAKSKPATPTQPTNPQLKITN